MKANKLDLSQAQQRAFIFSEMRAEQTENGEEGVVDGYAAVFNARANIGDMFEEIIEPGAFDGTDFSEVFLCANHQIESQLPYAKQGTARGKDDTLILTPDDKGLRVKARLDIKNNPMASALYSNIKRGINDTMSFMFWVEQDEWENLDREKPLRRIKKISKVLEVSVVNMAAYKATEINARSGLFVESNKIALENAKTRRNMELNHLAEKRELELIKTKIRIKFGGKN